MLSMPQNTLSQLISKIEDETTQNIDGAAIKLLGLKAQLQGNMELALTYFLLTNHPVAIAQSTLLKRSFPGISPQQIPPHVLSEIRPTYTTGLSLQTKAPRSQMPTGRLTARTLARKKLETEFTQKDITDCIAKLDTDDHVFLQRLAKENSRPLTMYEFSVLIGRTYKYVYDYNQSLKKLALLPRWPAISMFGYKVLEKLNHPETTPTSAARVARVNSRPFNPPLEATKTQPLKRKHEDDVSGLVTDAQIKLCEDVLSELDKTFLVKLYDITVNEKSEPTLAYFAEVMKIRIMKIKSTIDFLQSLSLLGDWPELLPLGRAVAKKIYQEQSKAAPVNDSLSTATTPALANDILSTPKTTIAPTSPTYTPMQQSKRINISDLLQTESEAPKLERMNIAKLLC